MTSQLWSIQELVDLCGVTPRAVRFYEDKGLLSPVGGRGGVFLPGQTISVSPVFCGPTVWPG
ncbi:MAG: MerR family DNA-binding transcriptional regulator [Hyphomonadaceae bacterium]|nr:MerR family DNA-binding transcriptional regulator [Hyphomonadaceae bacterium]